MGDPQESRPAVPAALKRRLFEEAGYRCAIPTCKGTAALEMAHIEPWSKVRTHDFENMIVLCAVDHFRFDRGEIPAASIRAFKTNLSVLTHRYNDTEQRVLTVFAMAAAEAGLESRVLVMPGGSSFMLMYLEQDGLITIRPDTGITMNGIAAHEHVQLTVDGAAFVRQMVAAQPII